MADKIVTHTTLPEGVTVEDVGKLKVVNTTKRKLVLKSYNRARQEDDEWVSHMELTDGQFIHDYYQSDVGRVVGFFLGDGNKPEGEFTVTIDRDA